MVLAVWKTSVTKNRALPSSGGVTGTLCIELDGWGCIDGVIRLLLGLEKRVCYETACPAATQHIESRPDWYIIFQILKQVCQVSRESVCSPEAKRPQCLTDDQIGLIFLAALGRVRW